MKIRSIEVNDVFTVARMLGKITKSARDELSAAVKAEEPDVEALGISLAQSIMLEAEDDLKDWLANLAGKKTEEFGKMPAMAVLDVIEGLMAQEGIKDFFVRASQLGDKLTSAS